MDPNPKKKKCRARCLVKVLQFVIPQDVEQKKVDDGGLSRDSEECCNCPNPLQRKQDGNFVSENKYWFFMIGRTIRFCEECLMQHQHQRGLGKH
jgi:hypothetical protein